MNLKIAARNPQQLKQGPVCVEMKVIALGLIFYV